MVVFLLMWESRFSLNHAESRRITTDQGSELTRSLPEKSYTEAAMAGMASTRSVVTFSALVLNT